MIWSNIKYDIVVITSKSLLQERICLLWYYDSDASSLCKNSVDVAMTQKWQQGWFTAEKVLWCWCLCTAKQNHIGKGVGRTSEGVTGVSAAGHWWWGTMPRSCQCLQIKNTITRTEIFSSFNFNSEVQLVKSFSTEITEDNSSCSELSSSAHCPSHVEHNFTYFSYWQRLSFIYNFHFRILNQKAFLSHISS